MLHQTIKEQIKDAMRARDVIKLETLRGLNALFINEMLTTKAPKGSSGGVDSEFLPDEKVLALIKRSVKQRKDSIEQFTKGNRKDLVKKEQAELAILESYMPQTMSRKDIGVIVSAHLKKAQASGAFDPKSIGKLTGTIMKELAGKADGADVKAVLDELLKA